MLRKYKKELVWFGLFILLLALLGLGLYVLAHKTVITNIIVILCLACLGLAEIVNYGCNIIDQIVKKIFKDKEKEWLDDYITKLQSGKKIEEE